MRTIARKSKTAISVSAAVLLIGSLFWLSRTPPIPEIKSVAGIASREWHSYDGISPMYESTNYEVKGKSPDQVDALIRDELKLPEGERHRMIKHTMTSIGHHVGLPKGVNVIAVANGFTDRGEVVTTVSVVRELSWLQEKLARTTELETSA